MIRQNIDALKLLNELYRMMKETEASRFSILDAITLLTINEHREATKADITEILYGDRQANKSSLDKPISRLMEFDLVKATPITGTVARNGKPRVFYSISKNGETFLRKMQFKH